MSDHEPAERAAEYDPWEWKEEYDELEGEELAALLYAELVEKYGAPTPEVLRRVDPAVLRLLMDL